MAVWKSAAASILVTKNTDIVCVRAGSVLFLFGVGSLVCWKLWDYWSTAGDEFGSPGSQNSSPGSSPLKSAKKAIIKTFYEEEFLQDCDDFEDEDPAFIQRLIDIGLLYVRSYLVGKYFGPDSPCDPYETTENLKLRDLINTGIAVVREALRDSEEGSESSPNQGSLTDRYFADDDGDSFNSTSCSEELPCDKEEIEVRRRIRMRKRTRDRLRKTANESMSRTKSRGRSASLIEERIISICYDAAKESGSTPKYPIYSRFHVKNHLTPSSSEISPNLNANENLLGNTQKDVWSGAHGLQRCGHSSKQGAGKNDVFANVGSGDESMEEQHSPTMPRRTANRAKSLTTEPFLADMIEKLRSRRGSRPSLSRSPSTFSIPFLPRDASICSNISDLALSECYSDFSLDLRDESIAEHTFDRIAELEMEIGTIKSSVLEMDEEFFKYASRPNPYLMKTTYDDILSMGSDDDSRPSSRREREFLSVEFEVERFSKVEEGPVKGGLFYSPNGEDMNRDMIDYEQGRSIMVDSGMGESAWGDSFASLQCFKMQAEEARAEITEAIRKKRSTAKREKKSLHARSSSVPVVELRKMGSADDPSPCLEWDNEALHQYEESVKQKDNKKSSIGCKPAELERHQYLPDHSSLELDLEEELNHSPSGNHRKFPIRKAVSPALSSSESAFDMPSPVPFQMPKNVSGPEHTRPSSLPVESSQLLFFQESLNRDIATDDCQDEAKLPVFTDKIISSKRRSIYRDSALTTSIDSAICLQSTSASRSCSSSPVALLTSSMMSSGLGTSLSEASPDCCEGGWVAAEESGARLKNWLAGTLQEEDNSGVLSPVEEGRERDSSQSCTTSPEHQSENGNLNHPQTRYLTNSPKEKTPPSLKNTSFDITPDTIDQQSNYRNHTNNSNLLHIGHGTQWTRIQSSTASRTKFELDEASENTPKPVDLNVGYIAESDFRNTDRTNNNLSMGNTFNNATKDAGQRIEDVHEHRTSEPCNKTEAVGEKIDVVAYSRREWQGTTSKAHTIRQGYLAIPSKLGLYHVRKIRGDNYCAIRATLFQILGNGIPLPSGYEAYNSLLKEHTMNGAFSSWLSQYSFGNRISFPSNNIMSAFKECLDSLDSVSRKLSSNQNRMEQVAKTLNTNSALDVRLCEAVKLHMLASAMDLFTMVEEEQNAPLFALIMFARQSCSNPMEFMLNHLNMVGDTAGLEQVEMFLLGHALGVTLRVARPACFGSEDFISFYPDDNIGYCPEVTLIAEDDRHYNVLVE